MKIYQSWLGAAFSLIYTAAAVYVVQDEVRHTGGGWINLRGLGTVLITAPSQLTLGAALRRLGVPQVNFAEPGVSGYAQLTTHVLVSALVIYLIGYAVEWALRRWVLL
jgi:hypothetical protein